MQPHILSWALKHKCECCILSFSPDINISGNTVSNNGLPCRGEVVRVYSGADGASTLSAPAPLSSISATGPAGFAALTADYSQVCTTPLVSGSEQGLSCQSLTALGATQASFSDAAQLVATAHGWALASGDAGVRGYAFMCVSVRAHMCVRTDAWGVHTCTSVLVHARPRFASCT